MKNLTRLFAFAFIAFAAMSCTMQDTSTADKSQQITIGQEELTDLSRGRCDTYGTVRKLDDRFSCQYVIQLRNGRLISPVNVEEIPFDLENAQQVHLGFEVVGQADRGCLEALYATIHCISLTGDGDYVPQDMNESVPTE